MADPTNLSFETVDTTPGTAAGWVRTVLGTPVFDFMEFGNNSPALEDFEYDEFAADTYVWSLTLGNTVELSWTTLMVATDKFYEDFEELWDNNSQYLWAFSSASFATFRGALTDTFISPTANLTINDNGSNSDTVTASGLVSPANVFATLNLAHPRMEDLEISLDSPAVNGTSGFLWNRASGASEMKLVVDVGADPADFLGDTINGVWQLTVYDYRAGTTGTLRSWYLQFYGDRIELDGFEQGWGNDVGEYALSWDDVTEAAFTDEDFETGWDNDTYYLDFGDPSWSTADFMFDWSGFGSATENFSNAYPLTLVTPLPDPDYKFITNSAHELVASDLVVFQLGSGGVAPDGINLGTVYEVNYDTTTSFWLLLNGDDVHFSTYGTAPIYIRKAPEGSWELVTL